MNTFLPCNDYKICAKILDPARLNRQITECIQLARLLKCYGDIRNEVGRLPFGVVFPPVVKLWIMDDGRGTILFRELYEYFKCAVLEWEQQNNKWHNAQNTFSWGAVCDPNSETLKLEWDLRVHWSHRSKLIEKDHGFYSKQFSHFNLEWDTKLKYVWDSPYIVK